MLPKIKSHLRELGFSSSEVRVYIALTQLGESVASHVAKKAGLPRTTAISILQKLRDQKYISTHSYHGTTYYWVESPKMIEKAFLNRAEIAHDLNGLLSDLYRAEADFPHAEVYDTQSSIKSFIEKTLIGLERHSVISTIDTPGAGNYTKIYSEDFGKTLLGLKKRNGIQTRTLIPAGYFESIHPEKLRLQTIEIREMPENVAGFHASVWIIDDALVLFSGAYPFIVVVRHRIISESFRSIYDFLWSISSRRYPEVGE